MGRLVLVGYKPFSGKEEELKKLVLSHVDRLRDLSLVTSREPVIGEASDGSIIEIFEWNSLDAINKAHENPEVQKLWEEFANVCEYIPAGRVEELSNLFSELKPVN